MKKKVFVPGLISIMMFVGLTFFAIAQKDNRPASDFANLQDQTETEQHKELVVRYFEEIVNGEDIPQAYDLEIFLSNETIIHLPNSIDIASNTGPHSVRRNLFEWHDFHVELRRSFPDYEVTVNHVIAEDDMVVVHYRFEGTHEHAFTEQGVRINPSEDGNNEIVWVGVQMFRFENNRVKEVWEYWDNELIAVPLYSND